MLTIFTIPKPFCDHFGIIQRNGIQSWLALRPKCEIILFGNEEGTAEVAEKFRIKHISEIACNKFGTPLLSDAFSKAQKIGRYQKMAYVNTDIILMSDFIEAVQSIKMPMFLMLGQRWDIGLKERLQFNDIAWEKKLKGLVARKSKLHPPAGIDYFVFPRGFPLELPPFAVGRPCWDNWLVYKARFLKIPVIDATQVVTAVHQTHSYSRLQGVEGRWEGPESKENLKLAGGYSRVFTIQDADWLLTSQGLERRKLTIKYLPRYFETLSALYPCLGPLPKMISMFLSPLKTAAKIKKRIIGLFRENKERYGK